MNDAAADENELLRPLESAIILPTLRPDTMPQIRVKWLKSASPPQWATWDMPQSFPFTTIEEIKQSLAAHIGSPDWQSKYVFLGVPIGDASPTDDPTPSIRYIPADYLWFPPGETSTTMTLDLASPLLLCLSSSSRPDARFTDAQGNELPLGRDMNRGRLTVDTAFMKPRDGEIPVFHAFSLSALLAGRGQTITQLDWNGRFRPYFPSVPQEGPYRPTSVDIQHYKMLTNYVTKKEEIMGVLDDILVSGIPLYPIKVQGFYQIRLYWPKSIPAFEGCESLFYRLQVTSAMPFMRLIPAEGTPVVKVKTKGPLPIPDIADPQLLVRWAAETSPTSGKDYLFVKLLVRPAVGGITPLYATLRIFHDGSADILLSPPKGASLLDPVSDIAGRLLPAIKTALADIYLSEYVPQLAEVSGRIILRISNDDKLLTSAEILKRVQGEFAPVFQEIPAFPGETPLISLRYKLMDQFASEDNNIFAFLTQYVTRQSIEGELRDELLIETVMKEYATTEEYARKKVAEWFEVREKFTVAVPETGVFMEAFNPGVDVIIRPGALKTYTIDVYRVDSVETLERLYTFISILLRASDDIDMPDIGFDELSSRVEEEVIERQLDAQEGESPGGIRVGETAGVANAFDDLMFDDAVAAEPVVAVAAAPVPVPAQPAQQQQEEDASEGVLADKWFITRLAKYDKRLFDYTPTVNKKNPYSRRCAANEDRQPAVLSQDEYDTMITIYQNDDDIAFIVYPIKDETAAEPPIGVKEVVTLLRFGTDPSSPNYYFCPPLFCLRDNILIREKDFAATKDRKGRPKLPNTCPFCYGKEIVGEGRKKRMKGYTVIRRKNKPKTDKQHKYIGFLSTAEHPENFKVPCCYVKEEVLHYSDQAFEHFRRYEQAAEARLAGLEETDMAPVTAPETVMQAVEFSVAIQRITRENIIKYSKHPILPARFGLLTPGLDTYFQQNSMNMVDRIVQQTLTPESRGFLRMGIDNTNVNESLLGVLAPLLYKNTVDEVRSQLMSVITPHVFIYAHYGNLVHEFFNPGDKEPRMEDLRQFASVLLNADVNSSNRYALSRVYRSYDRFLNFMEDPTQRKELRHLTPLLSEPGLIFPRGLNLIVLDIDPTKMNDMPIVRCPSLGAVERHMKCDTAFITRDANGVYELLVYTDNRPARGTIPSTHDTLMVFQAAAKPSWPAVVTNRVDEYFRSCIAPGRSVFTSQQGINPMALVPIAKAIQIMDIYAVGCVRDIYNHIGGLTFPSGPGRSGLVAVPVIDDGTMPIKLRIHFDWDDYVAAPADEVVSFYRTKIAELLSYYPGYSVKYLVRSESEDRIVAVQLQNGVFIPAGPPKDSSALGDMKVVNIREMEWQQNKHFVEGDSTDPSASIEYSRRQIEELYQHFRISVAGWLTSADAGPTVRQSVEDVIFRKDLPAYEKRKRLEILIGSTIRAWMLSEDDFELPPTLIRRDCRTITDAGVCDGASACKWVQQEGGKCMLHTPVNADIGSVRVNVADLFVGRVIEELVHFYDKRRQLLKDDVSTLAAISGAIHIEDQYIIPQGTPAWTDMLRMDWMRTTLESPRFFEELHVDAGTDAVAPDGTFPLELGGVMTKGLRVWRVDDKVPAQPLLPLMPLLGASFSEVGLDTSANTFTNDAATRLVRLKGVSLIVIADDGVRSFVRAGGAVGESVFVIYTRGGVCGLVVDENMEYEIPVRALSGELLDAWRNPVRVSEVPGEAVPFVPKKPLRIMRKLPAAQAAEVAPVVEEFVPKKRLKLVRKMPAAAVVPEAVPEAVREIPITARVATPIASPEAVPEVVSEVVPEAVPAIPITARVATPAVAPEAAPEVVPEVAPVAVPEVVPAIPMTARVATPPTSPQVPVIVEDFVPKKKLTLARKTPATARMLVTPVHGPAPEPTPVQITPGPAPEPAPEPTPQPTPSAVDDRLVIDRNAINVSQPVPRMAAEQPANYVEEKVDNDLIYFTYKGKRYVRMLPEQLVYEVTNTNNLIDEVGYWDEQKKEFAAPAAPENYF
jgi:hypothetical protein